MVWPDSRAAQFEDRPYTSALKESGGRSGTGFRQNKTRAILVVVEGALALTLLVGSALLIRSAIALSQVGAAAGIRLSLGADAASVRRAVVFQGMRLAVARDPLVFAGVPALLTIVAILAVWFPALRAAKVDPTDPESVRSRSLLP